MTEQDRVVHDALDEAARVAGAMKAETATIVAAASRIADAFASGHRLYACGNGGSACDAMHLVEELVARYRRERPGLPAHHLVDGPTLTCWSNDYEFETVFSRQVDTHARPGDILVAISTSGESVNVIRAAESARTRGAIVVGLTGGDGGRLLALCDHAVVVPATATERIQEAHIKVIHLLCELIERTLFPEAR